ncbi:hypothetical protein BDY21DRAFT_377471 [Lineolata rhizophorae]|uniref:Sec20 C-terminal domain-containing protein n=1 Tax=Lineolata rhizophorae TaxID=578093 RepID=A0A6A6P7B4_9PEZI|nr:hypothetical protein BDY21DRAFT_377471 [Lineolata rhizophorae]
MTTHALASRLTTLSDAHKSTQHLIARLAKLQPSSPSGASSPFRSPSASFASLPNGSSAAEFEDGATDARAELTAEIHEQLRQQEEELELLKEEVEELGAGVVAQTGHRHGPAAGSTASGAGERRRASDSARERARLNILVARVGEDLKQSRAQFRHAQLRAQRAATQARSKERAAFVSSLLATASDTANTSASDSSRSASPSASTALFGTAQEKQQRRNRGGAADPSKSQAELEAAASSDVTAALRRTHALLQSELSRSRFAQETLDQSSAALADLSERYAGLDDLLSASKGLLGTLLKSNKSDTWYLQTAFWLLVVTASWIAFRRFLYGPLWWLVWLPVKLVWSALASLVAAAASANADPNAAGSSSSGSSSSLARAARGPTSRPPLIVKPSAKGGPPKIDWMSDQGAPYVRAGGGGAGAKDEEDPSLRGSMSQRVGQMAEASREQGQGQQQGEGQDNKQGGAGASGDVPRRGDGTPLVESDQPRNPKKRMWDADEERRKRDEL